MIVNGGFFDIYDTGAPLGVGRTGSAASLHAARYTWNNAFWMGRLQALVDQRDPAGRGDSEYPQMELTNVNSPRARAGAISVWDPKWGTTCQATRSPTARSAASGWSWSRTVRSITNTTDLKLRQADRQPC